MPDNDKIRRLFASISVNGDQAAYRELFIMLHSRLKQFAYSIIKSGEEAEELVSDVFIWIWQKRDQLTTIKSPLLYLYTTTKNQALNRLNRQKKQITISPDEWLVQINSLYFDPEQLMLTEEMMRQVKKAVSELPPRCRLIFKLVKEDGLKYREVAELLQLSIKTIEAQMAIALRRISKCLHFELKTAIPAQAPSLKK